MPEPTTRRGRYLYRRAKYKRRRDRAYRSGYTWATAVGHTVPYLTHVRTGRKHKLEPLGKMHVQGVSSKSYDATPTSPGSWSPTLLYSVSPAGPKHPPHVAFTGPFWPVYAHRRSHPRYPIIGYHARRVNYWGHRPWRMTGLQRQIWAAGGIAYREGYFPDWDPLGRHPTLDEVDGGADPYSGPFPQTPRA